MSWDSEPIILSGSASTTLVSPSEPSVGVFSRAVTGEDLGTESARPRRPVGPQEHTRPAVEASPRSKALAQIIEDSFRVALRLEDSSRPTERYLLVEEFLGKIELAIANRGKCERPLLKLLLLLQGCLKHLEAETLTFEQIRALREASAILRTPRLTELDLQDVRKLLLQSGLDPSRPLGGVFSESA